MKQETSHIYAVFDTGTDATIHEHIKKILDRLYANIEGKKKLFKPSDLGIALILSYRDIGLGSLTDPFLRGKVCIKSKLSGVVYY